MPGKPISAKPIQHPDKPSPNTCRHCGASYSDARIKIDGENISFVCPDCGKALDILRTAKIKKLEKDLDKNFQPPITKLNKETQEMWQATVKFAQYGFVVRMGLSVIAFIVGMILLILSSWQIIFGKLTLEQMLGPGISFASGLGTMFYVVYRGPLKEIRQSVGDLGIASAAFIAYIHQVLQISHTFSYYYINQQITFEEMNRSSELIKKAMIATVSVLYPQQAEMLNKGVDEMSEDISRTSVLEK
jgi:predicted RNA-binding Zn-ribbon protein involved in translation (DUF1610 family)